jgi:hypothetical protein
MKTGKTPKDQEPRPAKPPRPRLKAMPISTPRPKSQGPGRHEEYA